MDQVRHGIRHGSSYVTGRRVPQQFVLRFWTEAGHVRAILGPVHTRMPSNVFWHLFGTAWAALSVELSSARPGRRREGSST